MTMATLVIHGQRADTEAERPRHSLEELVDRLFEALLPRHMETAGPSMLRSIHEARRLRQAGDLDGALALLAGMDAAKAEAHQARWAFAEWLQLVERRFGDSSPLFYSQGTGRAAVLVPHGDGEILEVAAVLGMRWKPGKAVSRGSLRGLRALNAGK